MNSRRTKLGKLPEQQPILWCGRRINGDGLFMPPRAQMETFVPESSFDMTYNLFVYYICFCRVDRDTAVVIHWSSSWLAQQKLDRGELFMWCICRQVKLERNLFSICLIRLHHDSNFIQFAAGKIPKKVSFCKVICCKLSPILLCCPSFCVCFLILSAVESKYCRRVHKQSLQPTFSHRVPASLDAK